MNRLKNAFNELRNYPTAVFGLVIILALVVVAIYTVIAIPYQQAIEQWRSTGGVWADNPKNAQPIWYNWVTGQNLPRTIVLETEDDSVQKTTEAISETTTEIIIDYTIDYRAGGFPRELILTLDSQFDEKQPFVTMVWTTPDGREFELGKYTATASQEFRFSQNDDLIEDLGGVPPEIALFADPTSPADDPQPLKGTYTLTVNGLMFEEEVDMNGKLVLFGQVHGLAGTDHRRRDLMLALLWGTPIALSFGLLAAVGTSAGTMVIAAVGVWFGSWVDATIQRITEVNLVLPLLPILIMIGTFYSRSLWLMLGVLIILSIFGSAIKTYRAVFLQVKESAYIEAARSYGANNTRIIFRYMIPRVLPLLIPQLVVLIPSYVFIEASLAVLGLGDPILPTWGKLINDARTNGALFNGYYYWMLEPAVLLMLTGLGFSMLGFALDRVFNPRLRGL